MIAAVGKNNVIGANNDLLWHLPNDFKFFKRTTLNRVVIMGRKTYDSMGQQALSHRYNFVLSKNPQVSFEDATVFTNTDSCLKASYTIDSTPFIIGGEKVYKMMLPKASHLFITRVDFETAGDAYFPGFSQDDFKFESTFTESYDENAKNNRYRPESLPVFLHKTNRKNLSIE
mgnify:CR=1 FL=1